jgi:hypothetical protein
MGLKGYRLWVMGQLDSNVQSPTDSPGGSGRPGHSCRRHGGGAQDGEQRAQRALREHGPSALLRVELRHLLAVAVNVAFERAKFETRISLDRFKGWNQRGLQAVGQLSSA